MSRTLSVSICARAGLAVAGVLLALTGCAAGGAQSLRPVAAVASAPAQAPPAGATLSADQPMSSPEPASPLPSAAPTAVPAAPPAPAPTGHVAAPGTPTPRFSPTMAYDAAEREMVLFGGETAGLTFLADTWAWDGHRWAQLHPAHSPSARASAEMAYDPRHQQLVLFGGYGTLGFDLADTWLWNGDDWTQATPAFTPTHTQEEGMTYFAGTGTVLMFSGGNNVASNTAHVYSWDGADWTDLSFTGGPPSSAFQGGFSVDPKRQVVVFLADDSNDPTLQHWEFDGRTWTHRAVATPPVRSLVQTATDQRTGTIVMFGGIGVNDTWTWDGTRWTQRHPLRSPSARSSTGPMPGLAYDAALGEVVVFGGIDFATNVPLNDTWTWNGRDWNRS
jgi:hypothetical protein